MTRYRVVTIMAKNQYTRSWEVVDTHQDWGVIGRFRIKAKALAFCERMNKGGRS